MVDDESFIPSSARIQFDLKMSKKVEVMPEFIAIKDATAEIVTQFQNDLTAKIIEVGELECTAAVSMLKTHLVKSIRLIMQSSMIATHDNSDLDKKVHAMMCTYVVPLTIHMPMSLAEFNKLYKETHCLGDNFPPKLVLADDMSDDHNTTNQTYTFLKPTITDDMKNEKSEGNYRRCFRIRLDPL